MVESVLGQARHRVEEEVRHMALEAVHRRREVVAAEARRTGLMVVVHHMSLGERDTVAAVGMDYAKVRHSELVEVDIHGAVAEDGLDVAAEGNLEAAVEDSPGDVEVDIDLAADNLEEGPRSPAVVEDTLVEDIGSAEVAGNPLKSVSKLYCGKA